MKLDSFHVTLMIGIRPTCLLFSLGDPKNKEVDLGDPWLSSFYELSSLAQSSPHSDLNKVRMSQI